MWNWSGLFHFGIKNSNPTLFIASFPFPIVFPSHMGRAFGIHKPLCNLNQVSPCLAVYNHTAERRKTLFSMQTQVSYTRQKGKMAGVLMECMGKRGRGRTTQQGQITVEQAKDVNSGLPFQELQPIASLSTLLNQIPAEHSLSSSLEAKPTTAPNTRTRDKPYPTGCIEMPSHKVLSILSPR